MTAFFDRSSLPITNKTRIYFLIIVIIGVNTIFLGHLFFMQIVDQYKYLSRAEITTRRSSPIPAKRGDIFDRNYTEPIAGNALTFAVAFTPGDAPIDSIQMILEKLSSILDISMETINNKIPPRSYRSYGTVELTNNTTYKNIVYLSENIDDFPGVTFYSRAIREYPYGSDMAHILGFVGEITPEELNVLFNKGYSANSIIGKSGIEKQYDMLMQGLDGRRYRRVDAQGRNIVDDKIEDIAPQLSHNLVLTIDSKIQQLAVQALGDRIGSVVVLKPSTGEILAMVSYPTFNPNEFSSRNATAIINKLSQDPRAPFINRAVQASGVPASTFKIVLTTAAIEEKAIGLDELINARLYYRIGNRRVAEWGINYRTHGFGPLNIYDGLANSSNFFFATIGNDYLGFETIISYAQKFGFGELTGIDLPIEIPGIVPSEEWKLKVFNEPWVGGDTVNLSLGQGFLEVTPIQLANMVAMIVNDGISYKPHILKEIRDQETGELIQQFEPIVSRTTTISSETFNEVKKAMRRVITHGTANPVITTRSVEIAGKTGTGEVGLEEQWHSWFVAFAPYETANPDEQVVVVVWVDAQNEWEWWAPKAANIIFHGIFNDLTYQEVVQQLRPWYLR